MGAWPLVSVIVPARNEARVIGRLVESLKALDYPSYEVLVVDDQSTDGTGDLARSAGGSLVRVIAGAPKPDGWGGKQWACHQAAGAASGKYLLFTDADTVHAPGSLKEAVAFARSEEAGLVSCLPWHAGTSWWERLSGAFHVMLLSVTAPLGEPRPGRVFAIGQYLLFRREAYELIGGHESVRADLVEDLPMANRCLAAGVRYRVHAPALPLFQVRMYETLPEFLRGWRRNFRAGMAGSSRLAPVEMTAMVAALTGAGAPGFWSLPLVVAAVLCVARAQRRLGAFSPAGALLFPWGLLLLCLATALAGYDMVTRRATVWKGRAYLEPIKNRAP